VGFDPPLFVAPFATQSTPRSHAISYSKAIDSKELVREW